MKFLLMKTGDLEKDILKQMFKKLQIVIYFYDI